MATYLLMSEDEMVQGAVQLLTEQMERRKGVLGKAREVMERYGLDTGFLYHPDEMNAKARKEGLAELGRAQKKALTTRLEEKVYHGSCATEVRKQGLDKKATHAWVKEGKLTPKSEGIIMAAQDRILLTRDFKLRHIERGLDPTCRLCGKHKETLGHILMKCPVYEHKEFTQRHDAVLYLLVKAIGATRSPRASGSQEEEYAEG